METWYQYTCGQPLQWLFVVYREMGTSDRTACIVMHVIGWRHKWSYSGLVRALSDTPGTGVSKLVSGTGVS
jgi:hypothetical protein